MLGHLDDALLGQKCVLAQHSVQHAAERVPGRIGWNATANPGLEEGAGDAVADPDAGDVGADRNHFACAIRQRNDRKFRIAVDTFDDAEVAVVDCAGAHPHDDLPGASLRVGPFRVEHKAVKVVGLIQLPALHHGLRALGALPPRSLTTGFAIRGKATGGRLHRPCISLAVCCRAPFSRLVTAIPSLLARFSTA